MNHFTKAEMLSAGTLIQLAKANAKQYCTNHEDIDAAAEAALMVALEIFNTGIPAELVASLEYRDQRETCKHCNIPMELGKAMVNRATGTNDFAGGEVVTMSLDPKQSVMIDCWKCTECGFSRSAGSVVS